MAEENGNQPVTRAELRQELGLQRQELREELRQQQQDLREELRQQQQELREELRQQQQELREELRQQQQHFAEMMERMETKLLTAFHNWARTYESRTRGLSGAVIGIEERLAIVEDRVSRLERGDKY